MVHVICLQTFLISVVFSDWIEITKVGHSNSKQIDGPKILFTPTPPSFKVTLDRPTNLHEITIIKKSKPQQNEGNSSSKKLIYNNSVTHKINASTSKITHKSDEEIFNKGNAQNNITKDYFIQEGKDINISLEDDNQDSDEDMDEQNNKKVSVMSIIRQVQTQLLDFKGRSLEAKIEHLEKLRDKMIHEIKYRISYLLNPPKKENQSESRLFKDESGEYHMEYPSNEGALMTIGLLTFAVFLIKLVLKLIYIFKLKQQNYYTTTTTPVSIFLRETNREIEPDDKIEESVRILRYIEEYSPS